VIRERVGRLVLRCFPRQARAQRGGEMLDTMLEASCGSARAFVFEAASLGFAGLRERASAGTPVSTGSLVAEGFRRAAVIWVALVLTVLLRPRLQTHWRLPLQTYWRPPHALELLIVVVLVCWVLGYRRAAGVCGFVMLGCGAGRWLGPLEAPGSPLWCLFAWYAIPFVGFVLMVVGRSPPSRALRRRSWMLPLSAIALLAVPIDAFGILPGVLIGLSALTIVGLLLIAIDPRLWIATGARLDGDRRLLDRDVGRPSAGSGPADLRRDSFDRGRARRDRADARAGSASPPVRRHASRPL
jgi:hypothetical protein